MALPTTNYDDVYELVEVLSGTRITPGDAYKVKSLINAACRRAYRRSSFWERYLVVGQAVVPTDGLIVSDAASAKLIDGTTAQTYPTINTLLHVARRSQLDTGIYPSIPFAASQGGYEIMGSHNDLDEVFCMYKAGMPLRFGNETGETPDVPEEWADFAAHYAARMLQVSMRQGNQNPMVTIAMKEVDGLLEDALARMEDQKYAQFLGQFITSGTLDDQTLGY